VYTRTGRSFFPDADVTRELVSRLASACSPLFANLDTDWLAIDCEVLPWSAKAVGLICEQYASVGAAAHTALPSVAAALTQAADRGLDVAALSARTSSRTANAEAFRDAYAAYCRPTTGLDGVSVAPFQILAVEGRALALTQRHAWHLAQLSKLSGDLITPTRHVVVNLASATARASAVDWWLSLTSSGGEGMVVKPGHPVSTRVQPGLKVRGAEYLRIVYGPDYTDSLDVLRQRHLGKKRTLALREHGLGHEALTRFVEREPLWRVHQTVFAVLALESEPVDPRL
jgi:hypothetical protein